jgi:hypothetical protein
MEIRMVDNTESEENGVVTTQNGWTVANQLKLISLLATSVLSMASLIVSGLAQRSANQANQAVNASRVETNWVTSNANAGADDPWHQWVDWPEPRTAYVGLQRKILFSKPFATLPSVSTAFSLIDTHSLDSLLAGLGGRLDTDVVSGARNEIHVITYADSVSTKGFILHVGIGLPFAAGTHLQSVLSTRIPDAQLINRLKGTGQIGGNIDHASETWMVNFFQTVGTINVSWIAQASEK